MPQDTDCHSSVSYAFIGMGANLPSAVGCPEKTLLAALEKLTELGFGADLVSRFWETPCFPTGSGPDFVNAVVRIPTNFSPQAILMVLHDVEAAFGRERKKRWGARSLDIDLLAFGQQVSPSRQVFSYWFNLTQKQQESQSPEHLILPHPRLQDRAFVLIPFAEIAPDWQHPILGKTVAEMCSELSQGDREAIKPL